MVNSNLAPKTAEHTLVASPDNSTIYIYGGEFQETTIPPQDAIYAYNIANNAWSAATTKGDNVLRVAEGFGVSNGKTFYYVGGHIDDHTSPGFGDRIYVNTILELDLPSMTWTNMTVSNPPVFRADHTSTLLPNGLIVNIGGGNDQQLIDMRTLDVFDPVSKAWIKKATTGQTPNQRVNHCAVYSMFF